MNGNFNTITLNVYGTLISLIIKGNDNTIKKNSNKNFSFMNNGFNNIILDMDKMNNNMNQNNLFLNNNNFNRLS